MRRQDLPEVKVISSLIDFASSPIVGMMGLIGTLLGIVLSVVLFLRSRSTREPVWAIQTMLLHPESARTKEASEAEDNEARSLVRFSNKGSRYFDKTHIIRPLRILPTTKAVRIVAATVLQSSRDSGFSVRLSTPATGELTEVEIDFAYVDHNGFVVIEVVHSGRSDGDLRLVGRIKGATPLKKVKVRDVLRAVSTPRGRWLWMRSQINLDNQSEIPAKRSSHTEPYAATIPEQIARPDSRILLDRQQHGAPPKLSPIPEPLLGTVAPQLEAVVALSNEAADAPADVLGALRQSTVLGLGQPAGDTSNPGQGTEADLLHFSIDDSEGVEQVMLPVFTSPAILRPALLRNPEWQALSVLEIDGGDLWTNIDEDVILVINPWSRLEFQLPKNALNSGAPTHEEQPT